MFGENARINLAAAVPEHSSLDAPYREHYDHLTASSDGPGPPLWLEALADPVNIPLNLATEISAVATFHPKRSACLARIERENHQARVLGELALGNAHLRVVPRPAPYAKYQTLLVDGTRPQQMDSDHLDLALRLTRGLGCAWTGLFNKGGLTQNRFHVQLFRKSLPLLDFILQRCLTSPIAGGWVDLSHHAPQWPVKADLFVSCDSTELARCVIERTDQLESLGLTYDLVWQVHKGQSYCVILHRRRTNKEALEAASTDVKCLGLIGGLELCGWLLSVTDGTVFRHLAASPDTFAHLYNRALAGVSSLRGPSN